MGKVRKRKENKTSSDVSNDTEDSEFAEDSRENAIQTIIDQLQTANIEEKFCGLQSFAMLIENSETLQQMINRNLIKIVAPLIIDQASPIRNAAAGSLRNLSTTFDMCVILMEHDVMTPLMTYFHQYAESWIPDSTSNSNSEDVDTFIQCSNLLLNLCESSDLAVKYLGNSKVLEFFPRFLDLPTFGHDIVTVIVQCLFVVVEDNKLAVEKVKASSEKQLRSLMSLDSSDPSTLLIRVLASGVIVSFTEANIDSLPLDIMSQILETIGRVLSVDHQMACNQLSNNVPSSDTGEKLEAPTGKEGVQLEKQIKSLMQVLDAQQRALELVANICSCESEESSSEEQESSESDEIDDLPEAISSTGISEEMRDANKEVQLPSEDILSPIILEAFIALNIFDKVWARCQMLQENVLLIYKEYEGTKTVYNKILTVHTRSLLCLNNLLLTLPLDNFGGVDGAYRIWVEAGKMVFEQNTDHFELLEAATAVMRAALDKIKLKINGIYPEKNLFQELALSDIELILTGIKECQAAEIRANLIRMIGSLSLLLFSTLNDTTSNVVCVITEFIIEQAAKESEIWVIAEAMDTLVDLYAEDETDDLAARVNLVEKLALLLPAIKSKARQQPNIPKDYKVLVSTAISNLPRFIKYKRARLASYEQ